MRGTETIDTGRLTLRQFKMSDANKAFNNWIRDPEIAKKMTWHYHNNLNSVNNLLYKWRRQYRNMDFYNWCIDLGGEPIGNITAKVRKNDGVEIEICVSKKYQKRGYGKEAVIAVNAFILEEGYNKVIAYSESGFFGRAGMVKSEDGSYIIKTKSKVSQVADKVIDGMTTILTIAGEIAK